MTNVTKKQTSIAILAVVFAAAMIVSVFADNSAFATRHHKSNHQSISQHCHQDQRAAVVTGGAISPPLISGNNIAVCVNTNNGGNAVAS